MLFLDFNVLTGKDCFSPLTRLIWHKEIILQNKLAPAFSKLIASTVKNI